MKKFCVTLSIFLVAVLFGCFSMPLFTAQAAEEQPRFSADQTFSGESGGVDTTEYIYCDSVSVVENVCNYSTAPSYGNSNSSRTNTCAPVAGANVCGFYDRWSTNLIPNFTPGAERNGAYMYFSLSSTTYVQNLIGDLYSYMGTNSGGSGTTQSGFENGLSAYASSKGYSTSFQNIRTGSTTIDLNALKNAIYDNKVAVLSFTKYNLITAITDSSGYTKLIKYDYNVGHMMMVYGYKTVAYYSGGSNFRTDTYLYVSTGYDTGMRAKVLVGSSSLNIVDADIIYIG